MAKSQVPAEKPLSEDEVKAHMDAATGELKVDAQASTDPDPAPSVVVDEKWYRCKKPTTFLKDHSTGVVYDGDAPMKSPLTGFLQSQIEAGKMEECESPE